MAYTLSVNIALGAGNAGLASSLRAQLYTTSGETQGSLVDTGFVEFGAKGNYLWTYSGFPDGFRGCVGFGIIESSVFKVLALAAINPQEAEALTANTPLAELSAGAPPAVPTVHEALMLLYMALRNRMETGTALLRIYNDLGNPIAKATLSDDGVTFTRDELVAP